MPRIRRGWYQREVSFLAILLLAVGLSMDAMAAAAARGACAERLLPKNVLLVAALFGGFQAVMPLLGWLLGHQVGAFISAWDHWIAFALLGFIGGKMVWESRGPAEKVEATFALKVLLLLALATSIDALAAGLTLEVLDAPLVLSVVTIGVTTAVLSAGGLFLGRRFGALLGKRLDMVGGLLLIGLGAKILVEHLHAEGRI